MPLALALLRIADGWCRSGCGSLLDCKFAPQPIVFATTMKPLISHADIYAITILSTHFENRSHVRPLHVEEPWPKHPSKCLSGLWGHGALAKEFAIKSTPGGAFLSILVASADDDGHCLFAAPPAGRRGCVRGRQSNINDRFLPPTALCSPPCQVPCIHLDHRYASRYILYLTTI